VSSQAAASPSASQTASQAKQLSVPDLVKFAEPSIVRIETTSGVGSGFVAGEDGYVITNNHVVSDQRGRTLATVKVTLSDGTELQGRVAGTDARSDLALVKVDAGRKLPALKLASLNDIQIGQEVVAIGYALDLAGGEGPSFSVTQGIVSQKNRAIDENATGAILGAVQTDAAINHGNSGGPLLALDGLVVGVNTSLVPDASTGNAASGIGLAVGSDTVSAVFEQLRANGKVNRGLLGVSNFQALLSAKAKELGVPADIGGVYLGPSASVPADGPAGRAGIRSGDVITKIDGVAIRNESDLAVQMIKHAPGSVIPVELYRGGQRLIVSVTLGTPSA
jgi:S1-C subfamily serine protease